MTEKIDKGRSVLNAADETANPYGLILSEKERNFIYGMLNTLDNRTSSLLGGRTGWRPQLKAALLAAVELTVIGLVVGFPVASLVRSGNARMLLFFLLTAFLVLHKLNLLLTHETVEGTLARRDREDDKEAKERARYFKDMGCKDMSVEE